jgi:hypothetical protein
VTSWREWGDLERLAAYGLVLVDGVVGLSGHGIHRSAASERRRFFFAAPTPAPASADGR